MKKPSVLWMAAKIAGVLYGIFAHVVSRDKIAGWILVVFLLALVILEYFMSMREYYYREYVESKQRLKNTEESDAN